jgi:hypothetical protein
MGDVDFGHDAVVDFTSSVGKAGNMGPELSVGAIMIPRIRMKVSPASAWAALVPKAMATTSMLVFRERDFMSVSLC